MFKTFFDAVEVLIHAGAVTVIMFAAFLFVISGPNQERRKKGGKLLMLSVAVYVGFLFFRILILNLMPAI